MMDVLQQQPSLIETRKPLTLQLIEEVKKGNRAAARELVKSGALIGDDDKLPNGRYSGCNSFEWAAIRGDEGCMNDLLDELENNTPPKNPLTKEWMIMHPDSKYKILNEEIKKYRVLIVPFMSRRSFESTFEEEKRLERIRGFLTSRSEFQGAPNIKLFMRRVLHKAAVQLIRDRLFAYAQALGNQELADALLATGQVYTKPLESSRPDSQDLVTLLISAIGRRDHRLMRALIAIGVDVNKVMPNRWTVFGETWSPLESAAYSGDPIALKILIDAGVNIERIGSFVGGTALHLAAGYPAALQVLFEAGAKVQRELKGNNFRPIDYCRDKEAYFEALVRSSVKSYTGEIKPDQMVNYLLEEARKEASLEECYADLFPHTHAFEERYRKILVCTL